MEITWQKPCYNPHVGHLRWVIGPRGHRLQRRPRRLCWALAGSDGSAGGVAARIPETRGTRGTHVETEDNNSYNGNIWSTIMGIKWE